MPSSKGSAPTSRTPATPIQFLTHLISLVEQEQTAEESQQSLLLSDTPLTVLVKAGLALTNLSASRSGEFSIGLGGKTLIELEKNSAFVDHNDGSGRGKSLGIHDFRVGDLVKVSVASSTTASTSKKTRGKAVGGSRKGKEKEKVLQGGEGADGGDLDIHAVISKVTSDKVTLVLNDDKRRMSDNDDEEGGGTGANFQWSDKVTLLKVTNPSTFKRQIHFLRQAIRIFEAAERPEGEESQGIESHEIRDSDSGSSEDETAEDSNSTTTSDELKPRPTISPLLSVLLGLSAPSVSSPSSPSHLSWFDQNLNDSQKEAVEFSLKSNEVSMIWGPPGTGKTQTLVEIIRQLVLGQQKRVLVCGASNLSVDNILLRLTTTTTTTTGPGTGGNEGGTREIPRIGLSRLGHPARVLSSLTRHTLDSQSLSTDQTLLVEDIKSDLLGLTTELANRDKKSRIRGSDRKKKWDQVRELRRDMRRRLARVEKEVLGEKLVVLATTHGAGGKVLDKMEQFDVVIIDEAAQATEPACWIPIMRGKKLILAGDHLQLPPTLKSISSSSSASSTTLPSIGPSPLRLSKTLETTLFSRLLSVHGTSLRRMLKIQYRFNSKINEFPSKMLYEGELTPSHSAGIGHRKLQDVLSQLQAGGETQEGDLEDLNEPIVFFDTAGLAMYERGGEVGHFGSESKSNENEADIVLNYVKFLVDSGVPPISISIISPYSSQVALLSDVLSPLPCSSSIEIGSIDSNQGRENDVVIISLVRSNESGEIGFLKELRRLNVAMTRPRRQLVVVGDSETLKKPGSSPSPVPSSRSHQEGKGGKTKQQKEKGRGLKEASQEQTQDPKSDQEETGNETGAVNDGEEGEEEEISDSHVVSDQDGEHVGQTDKADQLREIGVAEKVEKGDKGSHRVTGARYIREWIEWLEENAYVRIP